MHTTAFELCHHVVPQHLEKIFKAMVVRKFDFSTAPRKEILKKISTIVKTYCHGRGICLSIFSLYCRVHESLNLEPRKIVLICSFNVISWYLISTAPQSQQPLGRHKAPGQQPQSVKVCKKKRDFFLHFPDHKRKVHSESVTSITITANTNNP